MLINPAPAKYPGPGLINITLRTMQVLEYQKMANVLPLWQREVLIECQWEHALIWNRPKARTQREYFLVWRTYTESLQGVAEADEPLLVGPVLAHVQALGVVVLKPRCQLINLAHKELVEEARVLLDEARDHFQVCKRLESMKC